nr:RHE_PE00001 family protein [Hansschlegelia zhihuaiae]
MQSEPRYELSERLIWSRLAGPTAKAEDALARLDERLAKSELRQGWIARADFTDACASLWLEGELVHVEDLVLHDAMMDVRAPTAELVRAHAVLRARRRIQMATSGWALKPSGLDVLRGRATIDDAPQSKLGIDEDWEEPDADDEWAKSLAAIDAVVARSEKLLSGERVEPRARSERPSLIYDLDWDEDARLAEWRQTVDATSALPPTLAAAIALDAWNHIEPLQAQPYLGRLLAAELLRARAKTRAFNVGLSIGLKATPQEKRWKRDPAIQIEVGLAALSAAAEAGLKEHDRLAMAQNVLSLRARGRRSSSSLPNLLALAIETPVVTASLIAARLGVTQRAATTLALELGLRETTGRKRYRAWSAA